MPEFLGGQEGQGQKAVEVGVLEEMHLKGQKAPRQPYFLVHQRARNLQ